MLTQIIAFFLLPSNLVIALGLLGALLLRTRFARAGWRLVIASLILLAVVGFSPVGNALILPLEQRFPAWTADGVAPDGIIVLGGGITPSVSAARGQAALNEAAERLTVVAELARRYPSARIVFSGGGAAQDTATEAQFALPLFESFGIARNRIELEDRSRNTAENAAFTAALLSPKPGQRWLLVTSAHHMPRAVGAFRRVGFAVEAHPVDFRTRGAADGWVPFALLSDGLKRSDTAVHEWLGLLSYWIAGRSTELMPGPDASKR